MFPLTGCLSAAARRRRWRVAVSAVYQSQAWKSKADRPCVAPAIWEQRGSSQSLLLLALRLSKTPALCRYPADGAGCGAMQSPAPRQGEPQRPPSSSFFGCGLQIAGCWGAAFKGIWKNMFSPDCAVQRVPWVGPEPPRQHVHQRKVGAGAGWLGASPLAWCAARLPQGLSKKARGKNTLPSSCSPKARNGAPNACLNFSCRLEEGAFLPPVTSHPVIA